MKRKFTTVEVTLPNGQPRKVIISPDYDSSYDMNYTPKRMDGTGYGITCESLDNAINFMFQWDCQHNIITNDKVSDNPRITPLPYKCTKCDKHFISM
jgi:hypothetical protein